MTALVVAMAAAVVGTASGREGNDRRSNAPRVRFEWGLTAGITAPWTESNIADNLLQLKSRPGFTAGFHTAILFNKWIALQPEVMYSYSALRIKDSESGFRAKVKSQAIQVPVTCSFRVWALRFNVGPVLTLMNDPSYRDRNGEKVLFGRIYPTLSYTAGVGVCLMRHLLIDLRYCGHFNRMTNHFSYDAEHEGREFRTSTQSVQLKIGFLF